MQIASEEILSILIGKKVPNVAAVDIIWKIRWPRAMTALLTGSALSLGGLMMQTLFRNPLAGPSVLGISAGASMGVAAVMLASGSALSAFAITGLAIGSSWLLVLASVAGSGGVMLLVLLFSFRLRDHAALLIVGLMIGMLSSSLVGLWQYFSEPQRIQDYLLWTFGSLSGITRSHLWVLGISVSIGIMGTFSIAKQLNVLLLGENYARSMGLSIQSSRVAIIGLTSLLTGSVTAFCGPIGFIGIAVPHLARLLFRTANHQILVPASALLGAILLLSCDLVAKLPGSQSTLPINAVTSLVGAPIVIWMVMRRRGLGGI